MKYIVGAVIAILVIPILVILFVRDMSIKAPDGAYMHPNGAILRFEKNGKLTISALDALPIIMINGRRWEGPRSNQVTVTTWKQTGSKIYIDLPGEERPVAAFKIDGDDLIYDKVRLLHIR